MKFHTRLQSTDFVLVPRPYKILIYEDEHEYEDEKNQIRSHMHKPCAFSYFPHSNFPTGRRPRPYGPEAES